MAVPSELAPSAERIVASILQAGGGGGGGGTGAGGGGGGKGGWGGLALLGRAVVSVRCGRYLDRRIVHRVEFSLL